jgi:hypothetical protein
MSDFKFEMNIAKADMNAEGKMIVKGLASGLRRDRQDDRFSEAGILSMQKAIEDGIIDDEGHWSEVPLRNAHQKEWDADLGWVTKAEIDDDFNLWITAELDEDNADAIKLYKSLTKPKRNGRMVKLGLSVQGAVSKFHQKFDEEIRKSVYYFDEIKLKEISVTRAPVYPTPYPLAIAKSLTHSEGLEDSMTEEIKDDVVIEAVKGEENDAPITHGHINGAESVANAEENAEAAQEALVDAAQEVAVAEQESDVPEGYVAVNVSNEAVEENVVANEEEAATETDSTTPITLDQVAEQLSLLGDQLEQLRNVQKSETVIEEPETSAISNDEQTANLNVQKSIDLDAIAALMDEKITAALTRFDNLSNEITAVKSLVNEIAAMPVDKSIVVQKSKEVEEEDFNSAYERLKAAGQDPIMAAIHAQKR